jgi:hypothetical protein
VHPDWPNKDGRGRMGPWGRTTKLLLGVSSQASWEQGREKGGGEGAVRFMPGKSGSSSGCAKEGMGQRKEWEALAMALSPHCCLV